MIHRTLIFLLAFLYQDLAAQRKNNKNESALTFKESLYNGIQWRLVGPYRGGRAGTVAGVSQNPDLYYMGHYQTPQILA